MRRAALEERFGECGCAAARNSRTPPAALNPRRRSENTTSAAATLGGRTVSRHEYRVRWTRAHWSPTTVKSRMFQRQQAAREFADRITADGGRVAGIDARQVGQWETTK